MRGGFASYWQVFRESNGVLDGRRERGRCIRMRWNIKGQRCAIKNTRARGFEELRGAALISMGEI